MSREKVIDKANVAKHYLGERLSEVHCTVLTSVLSLKLFRNKKLTFKKERHLPVYHLPWAGGLAAVQALESDKLDSKFTPLFTNGVTWNEVVGLSGPVTSSLKCTRLKALTKETHCEG